MSSPLILSILAMAFGLTQAQSRCSRNSCYDALAYYCPTTASSDCASLFPTTTVTLQVTQPQAEVGFLVTETVTLTEAFGACSPELPSTFPTAMSGVAKRQASIASTTAVPGTPIPPNEPCSESASPSPTRSTKVPSYAYRFGSCAPTAYASACSCLFGSSMITEVTVSVETHAPIITINDTTTAYVYTFLSNNCSAVASSSSVGPTNSVSLSQALRVADVVSKSPSGASSSSISAIPSSQNLLQTSLSPISSSQPALPSGLNLSPTTISGPQPSYTSCLDNVIVDILTDRDHCGACNNSCSVSDLCINGICGTHSCAGKTCGSFTPCGTGPPIGGCSCYSSNEGDGFCMDDQHCNDLKDCESSADCGVSAVCAVGTCCGRNVCMSAICANPGAVLAKLARRTRLGKRTAGELLTNGVWDGSLGRIIQSDLAASGDFA